MAANSLIYQYKTANIVVKIIAINALLFLVVRLASFFLNVLPGDVTSWLVLPEEIGDFITQPWSIITYSFLHFRFFHLLFNMYILYWFGRIVLNLFNAKRFLTIYLLGAICGGLLYMLAYNLFPVFMKTNGVLLGASAAVRAIMIFIAAHSPNTEVMMIKWRIKLWHIGVAVVLLDVIQLPVSGNPGGLIAHLGGALFGYVYAMQLAKGNDIGKWFENLVAWFQEIFTPRKSKPLKTVYRREASKKSVKKDETSNHQKKVDGILDKIGKSGYDSLTKLEKDFLFKAGKDD
ncbi:MAG: membrane associated rhomboid family serine protease [Candidatus Latescibacterota bacterium]|jgi:membrane associated rhomboid family serine protease